VPVQFSTDAELQLHLKTADRSINEVVLRNLLIEILQQDPRPAYQQTDSERIYGMKISGFNVRWRYLTALDSVTIEVIDVD